MAILFLLIVTQRTLIVVHFKLNQYAIEQKFCINKNNSGQRCKGVCYLKKELQETEHKNPETISFYKDFEMIPVAQFEFETKTGENTIRLKAILYKAFFYLGPYLEIIIPPPDNFSEYGFKHLKQAKTYF